MRPTPVHLRRGGVSLLLAEDQFGAPVIVHWGGDLGELTTQQLAAFVAVRRPGRPMSALDYPRQTALVPTTAAGFTGTPGLEGFRVGADETSTPHPDRWTWQHVSTGDLDAVRLSGSDADSGWLVDVELELTDVGLVRMRTSVTNDADGDIWLSAVRNALPVGAHATELLDLTGRWCKERTPQRHDWVQGTFSRAGRHGRTGHDATLLLMAGTPGFGFTHGEVWAVHTAWSGDHLTYAERTPEGECLIGGGELLGAGEVRLARGERYTTPWLLGAWSRTGMDALSHQLHTYLRSRSPRTRSPRPIVVNTWEAVYFDHDLARLKLLADRAAEVGAERFVLDDGWFRGRRSDEAGLGDWSVDADVWPAGLHPLIDHVRARGLDFGLWVEPEMINLDSDLARNHPDWILKGRSRLPGEWRFQQVLDLQNKDAYAYIHAALDSLLREYDIAYLKWDHNRDLVDVSHQGRPAVHGQTLAFYALLDELRRAHPRLEIESCASGGGRVDAEVLLRTDRIWPSDTIDAVERQHIQRWTSLLVPPELIGSHLGGPSAHTTGRSHRLGFRAATGILFSWGFEWDLTTLDAEQLEAVRGWVDVHREIRPLISTGRVVRGDHPDAAINLQGIVSADAARAWYVVASVASTATQHPAPVRLPGLAEDRIYRVQGRTPVVDHHRLDLADSWTAGPGLLVPGRVLSTAGVQLPVLAPDSALVLSATAI